MLVRIDKFLADMSVGTRSEVKKLIKAGKICVNGEMCKEIGRKVDTDTDIVLADGVCVAYQEYEYYMLHKPGNVITAVSDRKEQTVCDLIVSARKDLFPVGRLDKDTEGLLLITNHGMLAHNMLSPKKHVDKTYYATLDGALTPGMCKEIEEGVFLEKDVKSLPARLEILSNEPEDARVLLTIQEGRFHQVKRMFETVGRKVVYLKRVTFGPLSLDESLKPGEYRKLTEKELNLLQGYMDKI